MKKPNLKKGPVKKNNEKGKDPGDLKKAPTLKPQKEKEKQNWKNSLSEDDEDFTMEDDMPFDENQNQNEDEDDVDEGFYEDKF